MFKNSKNVIGFFALLLLTFGCSTQGGKVPLTAGKPSDGKPKLMNADSKYLGYKPKSMILSPQEKQKFYAQIADYKVYYDTSPVVDTDYGVQLQSDKKIIVNPVAVETVEPKDYDMKIAVLIPLTGKGKKVGQSLEKSIQMSLFDINNKKVSVDFFDTKSTVEGAEKAMNMAITKGAKTVVGPLFSYNVKAVKPIAKSNDINVVSFTNNNSVLDGAVFSLNYLKTQEFIRIIKFASKNNVKKIGIISPTDGIGKVLDKSFMYSVCSDNNVDCDIQQYKSTDVQNLNDAVKEFASYDERKIIADDLKVYIKDLINQNCVEVGYFETHRDSFKITEGHKIAYEKIKIQQEELGKKDNGLLGACINSVDKYDYLKNKNSVGTIDYDALMIVGGADNILSVGAFSSYYDMNPKGLQILGLSDMNDSKVQKEGLFKGAWFVNNPTHLNSYFNKKYKDIFNEDPHKIAFLGYDAIQVANIANQEGYSNVANRFLTSSDGFSGIVGPIRFFENGQCERALEVTQFKTSKRKQVISPAPINFDDEEIEVVNRNEKKIKKIIDLDEIKENILTFDIKDINNYLIED